jgi:hypothetical protein
MQKVVGSVCLQIARSEEGCAIFRRRFAGETANGLPTGKCEDVSEQEHPADLQGFSRWQTVCVSVDARMGPLRCQPSAHRVVGAAGCELVIV